MDRRYQTSHEINVNERLAKLTAVGRPSFDTHRGIAQIHRQFSGLKKCRLVGSMSTGKRMSSR